MRLVAAGASSLVLAIVAFACGGGDATTSGTTTGTGGTLTGAASSVASSAEASSSHASSAHASSSAASSSSGAGGGGGAGGAPCANTDPGEPNDTEAIAYDFGMNGCSDSDPGMFYGVLDGPNDVDWFRYEGSDDLSCIVNPTQGATVTGNGSVRVCAYLECNKGLDKTDVTCPNGTTSDTSAAGRPGCCGASEFTIDLSCGTLASKDALVLVRIDDPTHGAICTSYDVSFHF